MPQASVNGVQLHYEVTGEGVPVVFSHEFAGDHRSWEPQVRFFSRLYRCVTYSHRGYPPSSVPEDPGAYTQEILVEDLRGLFDHLGIAQAHLVGLSMGGRVVLEFALRYPERCRGAVVAGCGSGSTNRELFERNCQEFVELMTTGGMEAFADHYAIGPTRVQFQRKDLRGWTEFRNQLAGHSALGSSLTMLGVQLRRSSVFSRKKQLDRMQVPVLVLFGDEDEPCIDPGMFMKREIPGSGMVVLPQSGHTVNLEDPALFNQAALSFFQMVEAGRWAVRQG